MPKYTNQIVVFIDVLGVKNMLPEFEKQALGNNDVESKGYHESKKLNRLLEIFSESLNLIKKSQYSYYVFSDNICITISYLTEESEKPDLLVEILILISLLVNQFGREGYFIRGGVDVGWFLNYPEIAVGVPLANAYYLESKKAIFPRVLLSKNFIDLINEYLAAEKISEHLENLVKLYIKSDKTFSYINPFFYITQFEEKDSKIDFLRNFSSNIKQQLTKFKDDRKIRNKYKWLAEEFNSFLNSYLDNSAYKDFENPDLEFTSDEIKVIQKLKIQRQLWLSSIFLAFEFGSKKSMF